MKKADKVIIAIIISLLSIMAVSAQSDWVRGAACLLTGCTMEGDINMGSNNIINAIWVNATYTNATINFTQLSDEHWLNETREEGDFELDGSLNVTGKALIQDDLNVTGKSQLANLDVAGNTRLYGLFKISRNGATNFELQDEGLGGATGMYYAASWDFDQYLIALRTYVGRQIIYADYGSRLKDFDHAPQDNPTLYVHSVTDPDTNNSQFISLQHNQTDGLIKGGSGDLILSTPEDFVFLLNESSGVNKISVKDSDNVEVASIDSNGHMELVNMNVSGDLNVSGLISIRRTGTGASYVFDRTDGVTGMFGGFGSVAGLGIETGADFFIAHEDEAQLRTGSFSGTAPSQVERFRITSTGDVGVGTAEPKHRLEVAGSMNVSGDLNVSGGMIINSSVGIGEKNPDELLHIEGALPKIKIRDVSNNRIMTFSPGEGAIDMANGNLQFQRFSNLDVGIGTDSQASLGIGVNPLSRFTVKFLDSAGADKAEFMNSNGAEVASIDSLGNANFSGVNISKDLKVLGNTTLGGNLTVAGNTTLDGDLTVSTGRINFIEGGWIDTLFGTGGAWIDMPTAGPAGIGHGGAGVNAWIGYTATNGNWFSDSTAGDIAYRNTGGALIFGNTNQLIGMRLKNDRLGVGPSVDPQHKLEVAGSMNISGDLNVSGRITHEGDRLNDYIPVYSQENVMRKIDNGLVLEMHFDNRSIYGENNSLFVDFSENANNGTCVGGGCPNYTDGKIGKALEFDGVDDFIVIPDSDNLDGFSEMTISTWIKPRASSIKVDNQFYRIVSKEKVYFFGVKNTKFHTFIGDGTDWRTGFSGLYTDTTLVADTWYHLLLVYDGTDEKAYVNGILDGTFTPDLSLGGNGEDSSIGASAADLQHFNGTIEEVKIFSRALSTEEIEDMYLNEKEFYRDELRANSLGVGTGREPLHTAEVAGSMNVSGDLNVSQDLDVGGNTTLKDLNVTGTNVSFQNDVKIEGTLYGGSPVKIAGINISNQVFMQKDNLNGSLRFTLQNINSSENASTIISALNDVGGAMSIGIGSSNFMIGDVNYNNITALFSRVWGDMIFANFYKKPFRWLFNPQDDNDPDNLIEIMRLDEKGLNVSIGNITAENMFIPQYVFAHTNTTILVRGASQWTNITFSQEEIALKGGITHTFNDNTNVSFQINEEGIYYLSYNIDLIDISASASDIDVAGRAILSNGSEIDGSVFETDITKQQVETELSHEFLANITAGERVTFQFIADDADVEISTHGTFGDHLDSASIIIKKDFNVPTS